VRETRETSRPTDEDVFDKFEIALAAWRTRKA
jgi:hypothetical protein